MKVIQINTFYYNGGSTGQIVQNLSDAMKTEGIDNKILYGVSNGEEKTNNAVLIQPRLYKKVNEFKARLLGNHGFNNLFSSLYVLRYIDKNQPDIIHVHNLHGTYINISMLFSYLKKKNIPVVITMHDSWLYTGRCACYDYCNCDKWKIGCGECEFKKQYPITWWLDTSRKNLALKKKALGNIENMTIITPSDWLFSEVKKTYLNKYEIKTINNGIDLEVFKPRKTDIKVKYGISKLMLACAYIWSEAKGIHYLSSIADKLDKDWTIVVIGKVPDGYFDGLKNVKVIPLIKDKTELSVWYSAADVFVNVTLEDTFPTVNIESLACGTPCVTFDTGGSGEIVDENTGAVVDKHDWKALMKKAVGISKVNMTDNCVKRARQFYSRKRADSEYISLYKDIVNRTMAES